MTIRLTRSTLRKIIQEEMNNIGWKKASAKDMHIEDSEWEHWGDPTAPKRLRDFYKGLGLMEVDSQEDHVDVTAEEVEEEDIVADADTPKVPSASGFKFEKPQSPSPANSSWASQLISK